MSRHGQHRLKGNTALSSHSFCCKASVIEYLLFDKSKVPCRLDPLILLHPSHSLIIEDKMTGETPDDEDRQGLVSISGYTFPVIENAHEDFCELPARYKATQCLIYPVVSRVCPSRTPFKLEKNLYRDIYQVAKSVPAVLNALKALCCLYFENDKAVAEYRGAAFGEMRQLGETRIETLAAALIILQTLVCYFFFFSFIHKLVRYCLESV
jgi:hypothetical protein